MLFGASDDDDLKPGDDGILQEAVERWKVCYNWQGVEDQRTREDIKFANGDARNAWQWPTKIYSLRTDNGTDKPCLTINTTRVHNDMIINDMSKNAYGVTVRPTGGKASYKSAEMMQTLVRRTQQISKFQTHLRKVHEQQVDGGIGYIILETRYVSNKTRNQDIYLKASRDPTAVYLDPWITEPDGSDANFGFEFERIPRKEFNRKYPEYKNQIGASPMASMFVDWINEKEIMLAKYWRKNGKKDRLVWFEEESGDEVEKLASDIKSESGAEIYKKLMEDIKNGVIDGGSREVRDDQVEWFLIAGDKIIDKGDWAGSYIPICRCVGRELVIDATLDRKGHTRPLIDAQRMLNYNASSSVEVVATQSRAPWLAPARAVEGQEQWKTANVENQAVLLYNDIDDEADGPLQQIAPPIRIDPPKPSAAHESGMQSAERQMMMISGQFQAQMGENDTQSAASGKAIGQRKQQGDTATYHFVEHSADMLRFIGVQLLDLYPKIYDTRRALHLEGDDGERMWIKIDPDQTEAVEEINELVLDEEAAKIAFNPKIGEYECVSDPGPDSATQRQEAWEAYSLILQQNMALAGVIGDLIFQYGDFPGADKIRERLEKEIKATKPYLFDDGKEPGLMAAQQQLQRLTALNGELMQKLALKEIRLKGKEELRDIEASNAETKRLQVLVEAMAKIVLTPADRERMEHELVSNAHQASLDMIVQANAPEVSSEGQGGSTT